VTASNAPPTPHACGEEPSSKATRSEAGWAARGRRRARGD
jgi:hypothetical protein